MDRLSSVLMIGLVSAMAVGCRFISTPTPVPTNTPRPTFTRMPTPTNTMVAPTLVPSVTPAPTNIPAPTNAPTRAVRPTDAPRPISVPSPTRVSVPPQPAREGGVWDFEGGWYDRPSGFEGRMDRVAEGWKFFRRRGQFGQPTFNENKNPVNVHRGIRSQEIAFESSDGEAGVLRALDVIPNHRYQISAWGIHYPSPTPIELFLGIDRTGGEDYQAPSVQWFPWNATGEAQWLRTQTEIRASGPRLTIFLKAVHRVAAGGGATLFDDVKIVDLGE